MKFRVTSIRQRMVLYLLIPIIILLVSIEFFGFQTIRAILLDQLRASANSHLKRTATLIDSRLALPKKLLHDLQTAPSEEIHKYLYTRFSSVDGVIEVYEADQPVLTQNTPLQVEYAPLYMNKTVKLTAFIREKERDRTTAEVIISFYDLIGQIPDVPWWTGLQTFMIDIQGNILSPETADKASASSPPIEPGPEIIDKLLVAIHKTRSGAVLSDNKGVPDVIYGYHRLKEAPWTMVVRSKGQTILRPITSFRNFYLLASAISVLLLFLLLNLLTTRIIKTIHQVSGAANRLANGYFDSALKLPGRDELDELVTSFNTMSSKLQQGVRLKQAMELAGEVQRNLLPNSPYDDGQVIAAGICIPCDETGGDFFDIIPASFPGDRLHLVVGDVVGHGIGAALLMATTRAIVRSQLERTQDLEKGTRTTNRLLCRDTEAESNFVTLFLLTISEKSREIRWVRAGHQPGILYNLQEKTFCELRGSGVALGFNETGESQQNTLILPEHPHLLILGSDGVTELENEQGELFGQQRLQSLIAEQGNNRPEQLLKIIRKKLDTFRGTCQQHDDITLVVAKIL